MRPRTFVERRIEYYRVLAFPFRSRSTRTSSSSLFRFLDARVVRRTFYITRLFSYLFERVGARNEEAERQVLLVYYLSLSVSLFLCLLASLIMYLIPSRSVYLFRAPRLFLILARSHPDPADHPDAMVKIIRHNNGQM